MPDIITHYLFGKKSSLKMDEKHQKMLEEYQTPYRMGCCGPDFFFYYHQLPIQSSKGKKEIYELGSLMHSHLINDLFTSMFTYLKDHYSSYLHAYILGFVMHYYADRNCHPYVYYFTGLEDVKKIYGNYHIMMEVMMDQYMLELLEGKTIKQFKPSEVNKHSKKDIDLLYPLISYVLNDVYQRSISYQDFKACFDDYYHVKQIVTSTTMTKKKLVQYFEKKTNQNPFLSSAIYAPDYKTYDVLNLKNKAWCDPCDENCVYTKSFIDCFYEGIEDVQKMVVAIDQYLQDGNQDYLNLIQNRGFDTNREEGINQKYFKCMFEVED